MDWNRLSLFKLPNRHKRFEYVPRYYNPEKEELERKIARAKAEAALNGSRDNGREIEFRSKFEGKWGGSEVKSAAIRSNIRLLVIFAILIIVFYYIFIGLDGIGYFLDENMDKLR